MPSVAELMEQLRAKGALEKKAAAAPAQTPETPSVEDLEMSKLAEDLRSGGRIFGRGVVEEILSKLAAEAAVGAQGQAPPSQGNKKEALKSRFGQFAKKLEGFHGGQAPGSTPSIPGGGANPNVTAEAPGAKAKQETGVVNKDMPKG